MTKERGADKVPLAETFHFFWCLSEFVMETFLLTLYRFHSAGPLFILIMDLNMAPERGAKSNYNSLVIFLFHGDKMNFSFLYSFKVAQSPFVVARISIYG